jgi:YD repeat-containing protein
VGYATSDGSATAGSDYDETDGTLTFAPGDTSEIISIPVTNDTRDEPNETFTLALNSPANARLGTPNSTTVTITDDDVTPSVAWQASSFTVGESAGSSLATVILSQPSANTVTVTYATSNGTATAGSDYTARSGTITFAPGDTSESVSIVVLNDTLDENNETVTLTLSSPANATLGTPNPATLVIQDNDPPQASNEFYSYDALGNLLSKTGVGGYSYGANGNGTGAGPHQARTVNGASYSYDSNGNLLSGGGRTYTWDAENRPLSVSHVSGTESYSYDALGERIKVVAGSTTTVYLGGLWEETSAGATKAYYTFQGQTVAVRDSASGVAYLHNDHLGSVSVASYLICAITARRSAPKRSAPRRRPRAGAARSAWRRPSRVCRCCGRTRGWPEASARGRSRPGTSHAVA